MSDSEIKFTTRNFETVIGHFKEMQNLLLKEGSLKSELFI